MKIPGFDELQKHLPDYDRKKTQQLILRLPCFAILFILLQSLLLFGIQKLVNLSQSNSFDYIEWTIPILNNVIFIFYGTYVAQQGFIKKKELLERNQKKAFQNVVKTILLGISMVFSGVFFGYIPIIKSNTGLSQYLSKALDTFFIHWNFAIIRYCMGGIFLAIGIVTAIRAVQVSGIDTASMVYVYYPNEAKLVENKIYSIVRHPMYLAVILVSFGGFLTYLSAYSLIYFGITLFSFYLHINRFEDRELIERFGDSYIEYSKKTPAIFIHPNNWGTFFKFLLSNPMTKKK
jgi:protein-S-isoprenylcysteine O-methyltransferase Ste14